MNELVVGLLSRPIARVTCASALAALPQAGRALRLVRPPAGDAFAAFVETLQSIDPHQHTQCAGWTVHELTAHLAAGSAELADLIELELAAESPRPTRPFDEREAPYRALPSARLRRAFFEESLRAAVAVERLLDAEESRRVCFTGVLIDVQSLVLHIESELVLHRWDLIGDDATSITALSDPRYAAHAATTVADMTPNVFPQRGGQQRTIVLRAAGGPDIAVTGGPTTTIRLAADGGAVPVVQCHPAARTLMLWGRWPGPVLPRPIGAPDAIAAVAEMLRPA
jgi:uncharacterized protein (TIGR03083 family)